MTSTGADQGRRLTDPPELRKNPGHCVCAAAKAHLNHPSRLCNTFRALNSCMGCWSRGTGHGSSSKGSGSKLRLSA